MNAILKPVSKVRGGAATPHFKHTADKDSVRMPAPGLVVIPMQQHIGAPCRPVVKPGDLVTVGQVIGTSDAFVSAPIHSSISGKVKAIRPLLMSSGAQCDAVHIENDNQDTRCEGIAPVTVTSKAELLEACRNSGLVGIGGAGFPLHVKLNLKDDSGVDTLLINAAECEPYITSDYRECIEFPERVVAGIALVMEHLGIVRGLICVEDNKPDGIAALLRVLNADPGRKQDIQVVKLPAKYPQGAEKMLILTATGRKVPPGALPSDVGCLVMNVSSISVLQHYINTGMPLVRKRITVDGGAIRSPGNVFVPLGSSIGDVINFCGGFKSEPVKILTGGPMMGTAQYDAAMPILKQNNAIIALTESETYEPEESACIRCGRCVAACPMSLMPTLIERYARAGDAERLVKVGVSSCMECGSCAFSCPAGRPLVQYMKHAKLVQRKAGAK